MLSIIKKWFKKRNHNNITITINGEAIRQFTITTSGGGGGGVSYNKKPHDTKHQHDKESGDK